MPRAALHIKLQREGQEPLYRQLVQQISAQIDSGELADGALLPPSRALARQLGISRITVVNAYHVLRGGGYLLSSAGRGTFVAKRAARLPDGSDFHRMLRPAHQPNLIDFSSGAPPSEFFPVQYLQAAINHVLERDGSGALDYEPAAGYPPLRQAVREYVGAIGIRCSAEDVLITGGAQQAIDLVLQALLSPGETLLTADPTYLGIREIAQARHVRIYGIPMDADGIRIDALEQALVELRPRLLYVMPSYQNPTGHLMSMQRRRQLLHLAQRHKLPILEDEVYREFRFDGEELPPLKALDDSGVIIHTNAFTKVLMPGIRIGYLVAGGPYFQRLARVKQAADISTSGLNQRAIHLLLQRGVLAQQLGRNRVELRRRRVAALAAAHRHFPRGSRWTSPRGGLYLWVKLPPDGPSAEATYHEAIARDVAFAVGSLFYIRGGGSHALRLNFGIQAPDTIDEGFQRIAAAWQAASSAPGLTRKEQVEHSHIQR